MYLQTSNFLLEVKHDKARIESFKLFVYRKRKIESFTPLQHCLLLNFTCEQYHLNTATVYFKF